MYLILKNLTENDEWFSYLLCKKPGNIFEKENIKGFYENDSEYKILGNINSKKMLKILRDRNEESYVNYQYEGVTPYILNAMYDCLRSAISCSYTQEEKLQQEALKVRKLECTIGPFLNDVDNVKNLFASFSLECEAKETETKVAHSFIIKSDTNTLSSFLQKIFILSMFLTFKYRLFEIQTGQVEKFIRLSENWFEKNEYTKSIIKTLAANSKSLQEKFIEGLIDEEDQEEVKDLLYIDFKSKHSIRHDFIVKTISDFSKDVLTIIDYGCSTGQLSSFLSKRLKETSKDFNIYAYDISDKAHKKFSFNKRVHFYQMNLLFPNYDIIPRNPDFLILSEIIEHFDEEDRKFLYKTIIEQINPKTVIITTPNKEYNKVLGMDDSAVREPHHIIEFTPQQYEEEVVKTFVDSNYESLSCSFNEDMTFVEINEELCGLSLISIFYNRNPNRKIKVEKNDMYSTYYLPISNYELRAKEFSNGFSSRAFIENGNNIFYMAPTVPPVDYNEEYPDYLEHPSSVIKYYKDRGINSLVCEDKYMGSRAHICIFKSEEVQRVYGYKSKIIINTRNGNPFFDKDSKYLDEFYDSIYPNLDYDVTILDCEMMPWSLKAKGMIDYKFLGIGEASAINRKVNTDMNIKNAENFLESLSPYIKEEEPYCRVFGILALGDYNGKNFEWINGTQLDNLTKMNYIYKMCCSKFLPVNYDFIDLDDEDSCNAEIKKWKWYTENGGEGRVYKPINPRQFAKNGFMIQPMLKVRGRPYLHIVYGIDYLEEENFEIIKRRNIKQKRLCAIQETEISDIMLRSFMHKKFDMCKKFVGGFIGSENVSFGNIDKTL